MTEICRPKFIEDSCVPEWTTCTN